MKPLTFLSLFAGIGGLDLGLERAGMRCVGQVEIDPYCRAVLAKHWPDVPKFDDVRTFTKDCLNERPDLICGGFPCQDVSQAGRGVGLSGERSGLWSEFSRILREFRPRFALVENVTGLFHRGFGRVLADLAACGFDAEWQVIPAACVGAPHIRERVFVFAYSDADFKSALREHDEASELSSSRRDVPDAACVWSRQLRRQQFKAQGQEQWNIYWASGESPVSRVADGVPNRSHRLAAIGNGVVPQVAEVIGRAIVAAHASRESEAA